MLRINNNNKVLILSLTFSNNTYFLLHPPCDGINLSSQPVLCGPALKQLLERLSTSSRMTAHLDPEYSIPSRSTPFSCNYNQQLAAIISQLDTFPSGHIPSREHRMWHQECTANNGLWFSVWGAHTHSTHKKHKYKMWEEQKTIQLWIKHLFSEWCWEYKSLCIFLIKERLIWWRRGMKPYGPEHHLDAPEVRWAPACTDLSGSRSRN